MKLATLIPILGLLAPKSKPVLRAVAWLDASLEEDEKLRSLEPGKQTGIEIPDALDPKITSKSGKRFAIDAVVVKRLKDDEKREKAPAPEAE